LGAPNYFRFEVKRQLVAGAIFFVAFTIFYVSPNLQVFDSGYSMLLSEVILHGHSVDLSRIPLRFPPGVDPRYLRTDGYTYNIISEKGRRLYYMAWGGSILALPAVAVLNLTGISALTPTWHFDLAGEYRIQKILAALLMSILTLLIYYTGWLEGLPLSWAAVIALGTALGTQLWSTASRGLWEQTWLLLLLGVAILLLVACEVGRVTFRPIAFATLMSWMYFVRPMAGVPIIAISGYVLFTYQRAVPVYLITGLLWLAGFIACSMYYFGAPLPPCYHETWLFRLSGARQRLMAVLFSPSRGLFIYVPVLIFVLFLTARYWNSLRREKFVLMSLGVIVADLAVLSIFKRWWGGWCYGPRLLTDTVPFFVLLAILSCKAFLDDTSLPSHRRSAITSFGIAALVLSVLMNAPGALSYAAGSWTERLHPGLHEELLWDWSRAPFLAPLSLAVKHGGLGRQRSDADSRGNYMEKP
jgi:hypothetical protein